MELRAGMGLFAHRRLVPAIHGYKQQRAAAIVHPKS
jgi:hypothetical protein